MSLFDFLSIYLCGPKVEAFKHKVCSGMSLILHSILAVDALQLAKEGNKPRILSYTRFSASLNLDG